MQLFPTAENPLPPGARCVQVLTRDRQLLRGMLACPPGAQGTVVVIGVGIGAAAVLFAPKDQEPYRGTLPPFIVEHQ